MWMGAGIHLPNPGALFSARDDCRAPAFWTIPINHKGTEGSVRQSCEFVFFDTILKTTGRGSTQIHTDPEMGVKEQREDGTDFCRGFCPSLAGKGTAGSQGRITPARRACLRAMGKNLSPPHSGGRPHSGRQKSVPSYPCSSVQIRVQNAFLCVLRGFVVVFGCGCKAALCSSCLCG
jgi:hypothetical protein